jgi:hypothetical protein
MMFSGSFSMLVPLMFNDFMLSPTDFPGQHYECQQRKHRVTKFVVLDTALGLPASEAIRRNTALESRWTLKEMSRLSSRGNFRIW